MQEQDPRKQGGHLRGYGKNFSKGYLNYFGVQGNQELTGWCDRDFEGLILRTWQQTGYERILLQVGKSTGLLV